MSRNNTTGAFHGFSVVQPFLGAPLQWLPALGTQELDDMINAFLPGPASIQDKRAHISMDFCQYSQLTGDNIKFYPVPTASPVISETQWVESPSAYTAVSFEETNVTTPVSTPKRTTATSSKQRTTDFASHPGMRIMTKDGRDVTNSASRGCKTKEQRDHAHLMRIIKACDSCKRKKVRCDPSHKKRTASQASASPTEQKSSKRTKKKTETAADPPASSTNQFSTTEFNFDFLNTETFDLSEFTSPAFETTTDIVDWDQFVQQDTTLFANDFMSYVLGDYSLFNDHLSQVSPSSGSSSASPSQAYTPYTPYTPTPPGPSPPTVVYETVPELSQGDPTLPYLNPGVPHGTDYVDFNLFSPPPDFSLDEEPQLVKKSGRRQQPAQPRSPVSGYDNVNGFSAISPSHVSQTDGFLPSPSPGSIQSFSPGLMSVSHVATQAVHDVASPSDIFQEPTVSQRARGPDQHHVDRPRPGLEAYEPFSGVRATVSRSEYSVVNAQSSATASPGHDTGYSRAGVDVTVSPSLAVVASSFAMPSSPSASSSRVSTVVQSSAEYPLGRVDAVRAVPTVAGVSSVSTDSQVSRRAAGSQASVSPVLAQTVAKPNGAGLGQRATVSASISSSGTGLLVQCPSGVIQQSGDIPQQGFVPSGVDVGPSLNAVPSAATSLSISPARHLLAGVGDKQSQTSSWSSLVCSQLVVLGLVSCLLVCAFGTLQQALGNFYDLVKTLITNTSVSLTLATTTTVTNTKPASLIEHVKSRVQAVESRVRRQVNPLLTRAAYLPRLAPVHSLRF